MRSFTLVLNEGQINLLIDALSYAPHRIVNPIIVDIKRICQEQAQEDPAQIQNPQNSANPV